MKNDLTLYEAAAPKMLPGDLIVFFGRGIISWLVQLFASGPSHVGVVRHPVTPAGDVQLVESTIEERVNLDCLCDACLKRNNTPPMPPRNGVQTTPLHRRVANYQGSILWLPLSDEARLRIHWFQFYKALGESDGRVKYGVDDLFEFLARQIPILGPRVAQNAHDDEMVCSAFACWLYERANVLHNINWSEVTPQDLCEMKLFRDAVPILGAPPRIRRFNTLA